MISLENPIDDKELFYNYKKGFKLDYLTNQYNLKMKYLIKKINHFKDIELSHSKVKKINQNHFKFIFNFFDNYREGKNGFTNL